MRIALVAVFSLAVLAGCAAEPPAATDPPIAEPSDTPSATPTPTPAGPIAEDPAHYTATANSPYQGVQFAVDEGQIECAIYDPTDGGEFSSAPFFGCVTSDPGFPYPAQDGGPLGQANAFVSNGHGAGRPTQVTDATFGGEDKPLAAGHAVTWSTVTCEALSDSEVRCTDADSGHGIRVSANDYELF